MKHWMVGAVAAACVCTGVLAAEHSITVRVDQPGIKVSPLLWGIFFEDINLSTDGGIYAELVRNRSSKIPTSRTSGRRSAAAMPRSNCPWIRNGR